VSAPEVAPRSTLGGVLAVWIIAAVIAIAIGVIAPPEWRSAWMPVGLGFALISAFAIQLGHGRSQGFIERMAASVLGAMLVMGFIGVGFGLSTLFAG